MTAMPFSYFFFNTYPGFFLQALPFAAAAALLRYLVRYRGDTTTPKSVRAADCAFTAYLTGLVCLVAFLDLLRDLWFSLLYYVSFGSGIRFFQGGFNFVPDFWTHVGREVIGNLLVFLPFGVLYPLAHPDASLRRTILTGLACIAAIELLQPIVGRAFDVNDIILNSFGVCVSSAAFFLGKRLLRK